MRINGIVMALFLPVLVAIGSLSAADEPFASGMRFRLPEDSFALHPSNGFAPHENLEDEDENKSENEKPGQVSGRVLLLDYGFGVTDETGNDAQALLQFGANFGTPFIDDELGFQIGGNLGRREGGRFEEDITVGLFNRSGVTSGGRGEGALLLDYRRTASDADIFGLRLHAGVDIGEGTNFGIRARVPLNQDNTGRFGRFATKQRFLSRFDVLVTKEQRQRVTTILNIGYMFGDVDSVAVGVRADVAVSPSSWVQPMLEINFDGDYLIGVQFAFDFGRWIGRQESGWAPSGDRLYRPFPKLSFLELAEETR